MKLFHISYLLWSYNTTTFSEFFDKRGIPSPKVPDISSEDIPIYIISALSQPSDTQTEMLLNLVVTLAFKIEDLEQEITNYKITKGWYK